MRLGRKPQTPEVDREFAHVIAGLYFAYEENRERCARLTRLYDDGASATEIQGEALTGARRIAYIERVAFEAMANLPNVRALAKDVLPLGVHGALARLAYALTALAEPDPEPEALLSQHDLENLPSQYGIQDWVTHAREQAPTP
jgi:hypothetical protein